MKRTWIGAAAASVIIATAAYAGDAQRDPIQDQTRATHALPKNQDPPPGAENMDRRAERAQTAAPMGESHEPADAQGRDKVVPLSREETRGQRNRGTQPRFERKYW